jgi:uncharacterized protein (TIGR01777 family)
MRVLVAGASGFIGRELTRQLQAAGHTVQRLVRRDAAASDEVEWDPARHLLHRTALDGVDATICLSGAPTSRIPWTPPYRRTILRSRVDAVVTLTDAMSRAADPPAAFVCASAVGYYGSRPGEQLTEASSKGDGFLSDVVGAWELATTTAPDGVRVVNARTGLVVGRGGAFTPIRLLTNVGAGARFGSGQQIWPWISLHDEAAAIVHLLTSSISGPVNLAGPTPASADRVTREVARALGRPYLLRVPEFAIRMLGDAGRQLLLADQLEVPAKLLMDGFEFRHETVESAIGATFGG